MAIASSGIGVTSVPESDISTNGVWIKSNSGAAVVVIDGKRIAIDDDQRYQRFDMANRTFVIESGSIDYFTEV